MPLVSIIIPVYKVEKELGRCVDSVLCQTLGDIEVILVDDGSPDDCPRICDDYALALIQTILSSSMLARGCCVWQPIPTLTSSLGIGG